MIRINCELCGKVEERLQRALIEGVELSVCNHCIKFGKILGPIKRQIIIKKDIRKDVPNEEKIEIIVENYASLIRGKRESLGLTQKDFANRLNEKESTIHKIEVGIWQPDLALAKKLEKLLGIKLIEEHLEKFGSKKNKKDEGFTLGDFIKIKD